MFGMPWRKSTQFIGVHVGLAALDSFRCLSKPAGLCKRTLLSHVTLSGKDPDCPKQFMTRTAQAYPRIMCRILAEAFKNAAMIATIANFSSLIK